MSRASLCISLLSLILALLPGAALAGTYRLTVEEASVAIDGQTVPKITINGGIPGPTIHLKEGEDATITVENRASEPTSIHWHGILLPGMMDGVPGFNGFMGIPPGESFTYTFKIRQSGTYWYHSHTGTQDQSVLGAIVIDPVEPSPFRVDRDYVVLLSDLTPEDSDSVLHNLKADPGFYNVNKRTVLSFLDDAARNGIGSALGDRLDWGDMRMDPTDLADVTGYAFLANGKAPDQNETLLFEKGERVRLRLINGSAMTFFDVRIPGLKMTVVAADGNTVNPVPVDELRMGVAERYDVIVQPKDDGPYTLFAESLDRMGYARATLAAQEGAEGPIPEPRRRATLSMADMGMAHDMAGHDMGEMPGHDMAGHTMSGHDMAAMDHGAMSDGDAAPVGWASGFPSGARVLSYDDLKSIRPHTDNTEPARTIEIRLTGNMERYVWTLNGARFDETPPIRVRYGERVRLTFTNETMMAHPMHLHGMFFELENGAKDRRPLKDTVIVPPGKAVSVVLTAKEVGAWPLHCHLLYHMASGMMTRFVIEPPDAAEESVTPDHAIVPMGATHAPAHGHSMMHGGL